MCASTCRCESTLQLGEVSSRGSVCCRVHAARRTIPHLQCLVRCRALRARIGWKRAYLAREGRVFGVCFIFPESPPGLGTLIAKRQVVWVVDCDGLCFQK